MANERAFLMEVIGDEAGVEFVEALFETFHTWDDLVDGDRYVGEDAINLAFTTALVAIPRNPFFQRHAHELQPLIEAAISDWKAANSFERGAQHERNLAFVLRDHVAQIVIRAAWCVGGQAWADHVAPAVWRMNCDDTLGDYLAELEGKP